MLEFCGFDSHNALQDASPRYQFKLTFRHPSHVSPATSRQRVRNPLAQHVDRHAGVVPAGHVYLVDEQLRILTPRLHTASVSKALVALLRVRPCRPWQWNSNILQRLAVDIQQEFFHRAGGMREDGPH